MNIKVLTPNVQLIRVDSRNITLDFGAIAKNSKAIVEIAVNTKDYPKFSTQSTCGCSTTEEDRIDAEHMKVKIEYKNTHNTGDVAKTIKLLNNREVIQLVKIKLTVV